jgi:hypothetical protein
MKATVDSCLAVCQALTKDNKKFTFSLTMGKNRFYFSTSDQRRKVPARQDVDLKKAASSRQRRREVRAADPAVRQKAADHAAAAAVEAAARSAAAAQAAEAETAEEPPAVQAADAGAAGEAAWPGPKCSKCHEPTKGHTTGRAGPQCTALPRPERARDSSHAVMDTSLELSPVKVDGRQEFNTDVAPEEEEETLQVQVKKEHWPPWDAYRLLMDCENEVHNMYCCSMPEGMDQAPSPLPARVFHPYLDITGVYDPDYRDPTTVAYKFVMRDGEEFYMDCFEL